jgi:hypothetical protein
MFCQKWGRGKLIWQILGKRQMWWPLPFFCFSLYLVHSIFKATFAKFLFLLISCQNVSINELHSLSWFIVVVEKRNKKNCFFVLVFFLGERETKKDSERFNFFKAILCLRSFLKMWRWTLLCFTTNTKWFQPRKFLSAFSQRNEATSTHVETTTTQACDDADTSLKFRERGEDI